MKRNERIVGFQRSGLKSCFYCGSKPDGYDHIIARARGGSHESHNLVAACLLCNSRKRELTIEEFRLFLMVTERRAPVIFYGERARPRPISRDFIFVASKNFRGAILQASREALKP